MAKPRTKKMKGDRDGDWLSFHHFLGGTGSDAGIRTHVYIVLYLLNDVSVDQIWFSPQHGFKLFSINSLVSMLSS